MRGRKEARGGKRLAKKLDIMYYSAYANYRISQESPALLL